MLADVNRMFSMLCDSRPILSLTCPMDCTYLLSGLPSIVAVVGFAILQNMPKGSKAYNVAVEGVTARPPGWMIF